MTLSDGAHGELVGSGAQGDGVQPGPGDTSLAGGGEADPVVAAALGPLEAAAGTPLEDRFAVLSTAHERLQDALDGDESRVPPTG